MSSGLWFAGNGGDPVGDGAQPGPATQSPWSLDDYMNMESRVSPAYLAAAFAVKDCLFSGNNLQGIVRKGVVHIPRCMSIQRDSTRALLTVAWVIAGSHSC